MGRTWHLVLALVVAGSLALQIGLLLAGGQDVNSGQASASVSLATRFVRFFSYFTIQSNLLVLAVSASLAIDPQRDGRLWRVLHLDALLGIAVTGVVFATLLAGLVDAQGAAAWANAGFHYLSPIMAVLGWLFFGPRPRIDMRTIALAFVWPLAWLGYTLLHGASTDWYPYPFLNVDKLGYPRVFVNMGAVLIGATVLAFVLRSLDRRLPSTRLAS
ncbi:MAG TPA: Pr6Pr family membrane protein [Luteimonas sp.]|nr:Pr6Pr family membrane protein [Luteimonas sp.]